MPALGYCGCRSSLPGGESRVNAAPTKERSDLQLIGLFQKELLQVQVQVQVLSPRFARFVPWKGTPTERELRWKVGFVKYKTAWNFSKKAAVLLIATDWHPRSPSTLADP